VNIFDLLIVQPLFNLLMLLYAITPGGFGVSIIVFTILLRLAMYPLIKRQLHQTKMMRKLQPELQEIKRRTKGNRQLEGVQMMELYKKHGVSPFRSFGIVLIQLPIFIALYSVIQIFVLHRDQLAKFTYDFLQNIGPIKQVIEHPETFNNKLFGVVDLTQHAFASGQVSWVLVGLAIVAAVGQYIQSKQTLPDTGNKKLRDILKEAGDGKEADQSEINNAVMGKMIYVLPVFMLFIMLSLPGAIALYYATSTIVAVIQQSIILREDEEEMEDMVESPAKKPGKKATAKARARVAQEAAVTKDETVTRIVAKGSSSPKKHKK
jgi:YidC/Oxa1 family membrane protein insertase